jgi:hypothetical protein
MLRSALEPTDRYSFLSLNDYQIVSQGILCLLPLLYIYHYIKHLMDTAVSFLLKFILHLLYLDEGAICLQEMVY